MSTLLSAYQNIPHTVTNKIPAGLILIQVSQTRLSLTSPNVFKKVKEHSYNPSQSNKSQRGMSLVLETKYLFKIYDQVYMTNRRMEQSL